MRRWIAPPRRWPSGGSGPKAGPFLALLPAFLLAFGAGLLSGTPGGIGAFEVVLLALLPAHPAEGVIAATLAWRGVYHLAPAAIAALAVLRGPRPAHRMAEAAIVPEDRRLSRSRPDATGRVSAPGRRRPHPGLCPHAACAGRAARAPEWHLRPP
ncbi:MAG: YbhN family protein [Paracoccaceae bacterium]